MLTYTCVVNAHTRRPSIDRAAGKSASHGIRETRTAATTAATLRRPRDSHDRNREIFLNALACVQCQDTGGDRCWVDRDTFPANAMQPLRLLYPESRHRAVPKTAISGTKSETQLPIADGDT